MNKKIKIKKKRLQSPVPSSVFSLKRLSAEEFENLGNFVRGFGRLD
jgi:hypothetical protein